MAMPFSRHKCLGKLSFEKSSFLDKNDRHKDHVKNHFFNASCSILLPNCETIPKEVDGVLTDQMAYLATKVPVYMLIDPDFVEGFVKRGEVSMLSYGTCVDSQDSVALLPSGVLMLSVGKDTYQELGLEGRHSRVDKCSEKFVIELDLKHDKRLASGKKFNERVQWCFRERNKLTMDFLLSWKPADEKVCVSSIQNYFLSNDVTCSRIRMPKTVYHYKDLTVPVISPEQFSPESADQVVESCDYLEVYEWLGACLCGINLCDGSADDFVSTSTTPNPNSTISHAIGVKYSGMVMPAQVQDVINQLRTYIRNRNIPWCGITVHGFADSPVSWQQRDHGFHNNGDNLYTFVLFENEDYWLYSAVGAEDICP